MSSQSSAPEPLRGRLLASSGYLAAAAATYAMLVWTPWGQSLDAVSLGAGFGWMSLDARLVIFGAVRAWAPVVLAMLVLVVGAARLWQRRYLATLTGAVTAAGVLLAAELLKRSLPRPDLGVASYDHNTLPSTNVAACAVLLLVLVRLSPAAGRQLSVGLAIPALAVIGYASVTTSAHRPSDVLSAIWLAAAGFAMTRPGGGSTVGAAIAFAGSLGAVGMGGLWPAGGLALSAAMFLVIGGVAAVALLPETRAGRPNSGPG